MSYTPTIIVEAEKFAKAFKKIEHKIENFQDKQGDLQDKKQSLIDSKLKEYKEFAIKLGTSLTDESRVKAEKEVKDSKGYKMLEDARKYWGLAEMLKYYNEKEGIEFMGKKILIFDCECSSQAHDLIGFCKKEEIEYATSC